MNSRILLLKAYYQLDADYDERTIQNFQSSLHYFNNQTTPLSQKESYTNFNKILINLYRVRHKIGKTSIEIVYKKMQKMKYIADKKWLLEKIEELGFPIPKKT